MTEARILLGVSATLQGTVALTFGLAFFGLWRGFGRRAALRWTIAWMVYGVGVLNTAAGLAFGFGNRWPTLGQAFLSMPLLIGVLLFRTGTEVVADPERAPIDTEREAEVRLEAALLDAQRLDSLGHMAGGIAHDFGNTLVSIVGGVELAADEAARGVPPSETIAGIGRSAERGIALTRQLLTFTRRHAVSPQRFDAGARAESIRSMLAAVLGPRIELSLLRTPE